MKDLEQFYQEYFEVLESQKFQEQDLDYKIVDKHIEFLKQLDLIENSSISVFDLNKKEHIFVSSNFSKMLGYNLDEVEEQGSGYFNSKVHPEDFLFNLKNGIKLLKFSFLIPLNERKDYKLISDYRVKNSAGKYIRIIEQQQVLELD
ncbi:MAG: LuxR family transcriptional regulator, partial [Bacteroidota bacterium]